MATDWLKLAQEAFDASSTFVDANYRADWDYSLRAFRNEHGPGSKYTSEDYKARSRLFRPKTRAIIRKNEAAAAVALFSNMDVVNMTPGNPDDIMNVASTACLKEILEYRLSKTIPAFPLVMGAVQDAQTTGTVVSYNYWEYQTKPDGTKVKDRPCIELRPIENIRLDGGANWLDPVNTSPYFCDIIPMYVCDVKAMMASKDAKTNAPKWKKLDDNKIALARPQAVDSTRQARLGHQQDPHQESTGIKAFDIVWVMRWFMRDSQGEDHIFYTLGTEELLTAARPLEDEYFHGKRPYTMGCAILESHKALKTSVPMLIKPVQQEINDVANQRLDNVKFVLNKRWLVARGRQTDVQSLVRNVPGGVTLTSDPNLDIKESNWPDVTSSSYVEHDRLNAEMDDLAGNFSPSTKVANNAVNDTLGGSRMAAQSSGIMTDYLLRTIIETWWEPTLRQLVLLEQHYETDEVVLGICAQKAQLFPRFGISRMTDLMLMNEVNVSVNVGMGASNPQERFQRFIVATKAATELVATAPPGFNVQEGIKEIYSNAGYRDGARFFNERTDPRLIKAMQMVQQLQGALQGKEMEIQANGQVEQMKIASAERQKQWQLMVDDKRITGDFKLRNRELDIEAAKNQDQALLKHTEITKPEPMPMPEPVDPEMRQVELGEKLANIDLKTAQAEKARREAAMSEQAASAEIAKTNAERAKTDAERAKTEAEAQAAMVPVREQNEVAEQLREVQEAVAQLGPLNARMDEMMRGLGAMAGLAMQPKKKARGLTLKKPDGKKTRAVVIAYDDGTTEEVAVN